MWLWTRQIKTIGQRTPRRNVLNKWFKLPRGRDSGALPLSLAMCLSTRTVLFFLLINSLLTSLLSIFVEALLCKVKGPGPLSLATGLAVRSWRFYCPHQPQSVAANPGPAPSRCELRPPENILAGKIVQIKFFRTLKMNQRLERIKGLKKIQGTSTWEI